MILTTDRLTLRPYDAADLPHMQRYAVRPEFYRYLPIPEQTADTAAAFLETRLEAQRRGATDAFTWAVEPKALGFVVGGLRIGIRDRTHRQADLGFSLDLDHQGHGLMTEAVRAVLTFGFGTFAMHRIWATAHVDNDRSWRLMERVGMVREGRMRDHKLIRGQWHDSYLYARLASDPGS